jgi:formyl-CoA transferase
MAALDGLKILDMTQWEAGTAASQSLAFLGADVVKVEQPDVGDPGRYQGATSGKDSPYFINWNSNKRSVTIDLSQSAGREILLKMLPNYDVFIENYGPGVIEKLDLGYDVMKAIHPEVIYARIKGFGTSGPYADYKCMDMVAQAAASAFSITGERDGPPMRPGPTTGDAGTGVQMALAIAAAYAQKLRTGKGQLIEISMQEAMTYYLRTAVSYNDWGDRATPRNGNGNNPFVNLYPCKPGGHNDYVFIMAINPRMLQNLCNTIGKPGLLEEPRFKEMSERRKNLGALSDEIRSWTLQHTKDEAMHLIAQSGVPASKVFDTKDLFDDPHLQERGFIHEIDHPVHGKIRLLGWPARMSGSKADITAAPQLGEHTAEVVATDLGLTAEEIHEFRQQGILGNESLPN